MQHSSACACSSKLQLLAQQTRHIQRKSKPNLETEALMRALCLCGAVHYTRQHANKVRKYGAEVSEPFFQGKERRRRKWPEQVPGTRNWNPVLILRLSVSCRGTIRTNSWNPMCERNQTDPNWGHRDKASSLNILASSHTTPDATALQTLTLKDAAFLHTVGSFLLTVELFYLQLTILAFCLQLELFCLQF